MRSAQSLVHELEAGDPVEHYRAHRAQPPWKERFEVPQELRRLFRGVWGPERLVAPLLGSGLANDEPSGIVQASYTPITYRFDVTPKYKKEHRCDRWNAYIERAAWRSKPFKTPRSHKPLWCCLLMYTFTDERFRPHFWCNPLDPFWDVRTRDENDCGTTYYCQHAPLPVTVAFLRLDYLPGKRSRRFNEAGDRLVSMMKKQIPHDEWLPKPRQPAPPKKRYKVPHITA